MFIKSRKLVKSASEDDVVEATKAARANEFVSLMPDGYNTVVGERGAQFSGGQRQRVAIARTFLRNAPDMNTKRNAVGFAILAAVCYGLGAPAAKLMLADVSPYVMAAALYLGAGFGMLAVSVHLENLSFRVRVSCYCVSGKPVFRRAGFGRRGFPGIRA
ncbi:MAG: ATP-binding cassette domain-containing protein [Treponema sp.]|nr:ATP-binding cassette domain-containing protein [Treponema sp.]